MGYTLECLLLRNRNWNRKQWGLGLGFSDLAYFYFLHLTLSLISGYFCLWVYIYIWGFPGGPEVKAPASNAGDPGSIPGLGRPLEKTMATHSSTLAWRIPWTVEPCRLQSTGSQRVGHNWATSLSLFIADWKYLWVSGIEQSDLVLYIYIRTLVCVCTPSLCHIWCFVSPWTASISSSVVLFSRPQSFTASGSFQMSQFFASGGQSIGVSASPSVPPMNILAWFPLGWTGLISLLSKGLSRVSSSTIVQKH